MNYTFLISTKCNSRCQTCNIWEKNENDLKLAEWEKILLSLGTTPAWVTVSGGEPFIQKHLVDLCRTICDINKPAVLNIPTNASRPKSILQAVQQIIGHLGKTRLVINLSLDGLGKQHNDIRKTKNNFESFVQTYKELKELQSQTDQLTVGIHTVISIFNVNNLEPLFDYVLDLKPDQYISEIAEERKELDTIGLSITPKYQDYERIINIFLEQFGKIPKQNLGRITDAFRWQYYQLVKQWLLTKTQVIPCYAGLASCEISNTGEIWPCCVRGDEIGNLRKYQYNFKKTWFSEAGQQIRKSIKNKECDCPLANAQYTNMLMDPGSLMRSLINILKGYFNE